MVGFEGRVERTKKHRVQNGKDWVEVRIEPSVETVVSIQDRIVQMFDLLEVLLHVVSGPSCVIEGRCYAVKIRTRLSYDVDHSVVNLWVLSTAITEGIEER